MAGADDHDVEITDVQTTKVAGNFEWTLVRIYTDAGVTGTGEAVLGPKADEYIEHATNFLLGRNPLDVDPVMTDLFDRFAHAGGLSGIAVTAFSGIDVALHDVAGKLLDVPAYRLLGGKHRDSIRVYCDSHAGEHMGSVDETDLDDPYAPEAYAAAAEAVVDDGFDALKFDLDATDRHEVDPKNRHLNARAIEYRAEIVRAATEAVGDRADVAFDCHWSWTGDSIRRLAKAIEPYDVWWLEDTVPPENHDVQERVTHATDTTIAAGENVYRVQGARRLVENEGIDVLHPDVPKTGGMLETKKMGDLAASYYIPLALHNVASPIGTMASAHVAAACKNFLAMEYHARDVEWWGDLVGEEIVEEGRIEIPEKPGLGVDLDMDVVEANMVEGEELFDEA